MKKLILKTAAITLGAAIVLLFLLFGIMSLAAPSVMANFSDSMGMSGMSGDYCYQEYNYSNNVSYLARSFETAANNGSDRKADKRFDLLYSHEEFASYCSERDAANQADKTVPAFSCRSYLCGLGVSVKYRLANTPEECKEAIDFALSETGRAFPAGNPVIYLSTETARANDGEFAVLLLEALGKTDFEHNTDYQSIVEILKECINE